MAKKCPVCDGTLKIKKDQDGVTPFYIYCSNRKVEARTVAEMKKLRTQERYKNVGTCNFHIYFRSSAPLKELTVDEMNAILEGEEIVTSQGHKLFLKKDTTQQSEHFLDRWFKPDDDF